MTSKKLSSGAFGSAVEGRVENTATIKDAAVLGRDIAAQAAIAVLAVIGAGAAHGNVNLSEAAMRANAAHIELVEPPSYVTKNPDIAYTTAYKYDATKNENIGGGPAAVEPKGP